MDESNSQHGTTEDDGERVEEEIEEDNILLENLATRVFEDESFKERVRREVLSLKPGETGKDKNEVKARRVLTSQSMPSITALTPEGISKYERDARIWLNACPSMHISRNALSRDIRGRIAVEYLNSEEERKYGSDWQDVDKFPEEEWIKFLQKKFVNNEVGCESSRSPLQRFAELLAGQVIVDLLNPTVFSNQFAKLFVEYGDLVEANLVTQEWEAEMVKTVLTRLSIGKPRSTTEEWKIYLMKPFEKVRSSEMKLVDLLQRIKSVNDDFLYWNNMITKFASPAKVIVSHQQSSKPSANASFNSARGVKRPIEALANPSTKPVTKGRKFEVGTEQACWTCGNVHPGECRLKGTAWANHEPMPWMMSTKGKEWGTKGWNTCPPSLEAGKYPKEVWRLNFRNKMKGNYEYLNHFDVNSHLPHICVTLSLEYQGRGIDVRALLDTGASSNFLSRNCLKCLEFEFDKIIRNCRVTILTGFYDIQKESLGAIDLKVIYKSEQDELNTHTFVTRFLIIESSIECILEYDIIRRENMMSKFPSLFRLMVPSEVNSLNVHSELTIDPERGHQSRSLEVEIPQIENMIGRNLMKSRWNIQVILLQDCMKTKISKRYRMNICR